jgi:hypothetical protein
MQEEDWEAPFQTQLATPAACAFLFLGQLLIPEGVDWVTNLVSVLGVLGNTQESLPGAHALELCCCSWPSTSMEICRYFSLLVSVWLLVSVLQEDTA